MALFGCNKSLYSDHIFSSLIHLQYKGYKLIILLSQVNPVKLHFCLEMKICWKKLETNYEKVSDTRRKSMPQKQKWKSAWDLRFWALRPTEQLSLRPE